MQSPFEVFSKSIVEETKAEGFPREMGSSLSNELNEKCNTHFADVASDVAHV